MKCEDVGCPCVDKKPADESEWLSKPDGDGWWWYCNISDTGLATGIAHVNQEAGELAACIGGYKVVLGPHLRWKRVKEEAPPPAPLPRERQVTLTAKVESFDAGSDNTGWRLFIRSTLAVMSESRIFTQKEMAVAECRKTYGIEPEVCE